MDSPQSVVSPFKNSHVHELENQKPDCLVQNSVLVPSGMEINRKEAAVCDSEELIGALDIYIHQARDIHNICIYHKQDVYAKLCLTIDPKNVVSTKIINGGGRNPVFNENLRLNVQTIDTSLKCEIWMLSRVKNYLEDQLLGFALVPLSEILMKNGKLEKEFSLSSTDLFHSPAGFVELSISYTGASPDVMAIPIPASVLSDGTLPDSEISESIPSDLEKIEFPDPKIANEDQKMVSEYFCISDSNMDSLISDSLTISKPDSPPSSVSTNGDSFSSESSEAQASSNSSSQEQKEKPLDAKDGESDSKPVVTVNIEPEKEVVQQDIVDMYMKSLQQFTESLAKMKLPMDIESGPASSDNSSSDKNGSNSRVFYGSRAFF